MGSHRSFSFLFVILMGFLCTTQAYNFYVGGRDGWVLNPSENFNHWAERNRFQINDTLEFKYKKGEDSVFIVSKEDYYTCNTTKPIMKMEDGDSKFKFERSGFHFFITGNSGCCEKGQKLIVLVLAVRHHAHPPHISPSSPSPSPFAQTPSPVAAPPGSGVPSDINGSAPAPAPSSSPAFTSSTIFSLLMTVALSSFIGLF